MAGRFENPFPQFMDSTPTMLSGAKIFFYAAGTSTKLNTYSDSTLSTPNTNPVVLNSAGRTPTDIFLADLDYKIVLAPSTDSDPPTSPIWTADNYNARDSKLIAKTLTGSGSPTGVVAGTAGSASILPDFYWDYTNSILYVCTTTGTTLTAVWTAVNAATAAAVVPMPSGYLTITSGTPVITGDVTAATAFYYVPFKGCTIPIYNGSTFTPITFSELTMTLTASQIANSIYDVFVFNNSGVPTLVVGPAWSTVTSGSGARGTGAGTTQLSLLNGIYVNAVQISAKNGATTYTVGANLATYVGSVLMDGTNGQISCHRTWGDARRWALWNAYNRQPVFLKTGNSTASWQTSNSTPHQANNGSGGGLLTVFCGLAEETIETKFFQNLQIASPGSSASMGIGWNSTTLYSGLRALVNFAVSITAGGWGAHYTAPPLLGRLDVYTLEGATGTNVTFLGAESSHVMTSTWRG